MRATTKTCKMLNVKNFVGLTEMEKCDKLSGIEGVFVYRRLIMNKSVRLIMNKSVPCILCKETLDGCQGNLFFFECKEII